MMTTLRWMLLGTVLGFSVSFGLSCGPAKCTPSSCSTGCCDSKGLCTPGGSDAQCGVSGNMCQVCGLGQRCQLGLCVLTGTGGGTGNGGGTGGGATGGGTTGGGTGGGTTGGGTGGGTTGGGTGGGTTGGGTGGGTTGGGTGGGTTGGGTGGGTGLCATLQANANTFFAGMSSCGQISANMLPTAQCQSALSSCNSTDQNLLSAFGTCIASQPCTSGNEQNAQSNFFSCFGGLETLSGPCQSALQGGTGGGGGTTGGGGGTTGGGTGGGGPPTGGGAPTGGGGATGGGTGGGTPGCTSLGSPTAVRGDAQYSTGMFELTTAGGITTATDPGDIIGFEVIWAINGVEQNPVVPGSQNLATGGTYNTCKYCTTLRRTCTDNGTGFTCTGGSYLGRVGTMSVSSAPRSATGSFSGTLTNVTFQEWNLSTDMPVTNGRCFTVTNFAVTNVPLQ
ncbi:MAG: hypothetical protein QM817_35995 [Archangium sp.]